MKECPSPSSGSNSLLQLLLAPLATGSQGQEVELVPGPVSLPFPISPGSPRVLSPQPVPPVLLPYAICPGEDSFSSGLDLHGAFLWFSHPSERGSLEALPL